MFEFELDRDTVKDFDGQMEEKEKEALKMEQKTARRQWKQWTLEPKLENSENLSWEKNGGLIVKVARRECGQQSV